METNSLNDGQKKKFNSPAFQAVMQYLNDNETELTVEE